MTDGPQDAAFETIGFEHLAQSSDEQLNVFPFGVVALDPNGLVKIYSRTEERYSGIGRDLVMGTHFFEGTAQCMNNFMIAQRLEDEPELDVVLDYVLTFRMRPTPVRIRLLKKPDAALRYLLIQR